MKKRMYNHAFTIAVELRTEHSARELAKIPEEEFYRAVRLRLVSFRRGEEGMKLSEHFGKPFDSYAYTVRRKEPAPPTPIEERARAIETDLWKCPAEFKEPK